LESLVTGFFEGEYAYELGYYRAKKRARGAASFAALLSLANVLLAASGRFPEKKGELLCPRCSCSRRCCFCP
jgi:hypothetical protein